MINQISEESLAFLAKSAEEFLNLNQAEDIYQFIGRQLQGLFGEKAFIVINSFNKEERKLEIKALLGIGTFSKAILEAFGRDPVGITFEINNEKALEDLTSGRLVKVQGGLYELAFGTLSKSVAGAIEIITGISHFYVMGFSVGGELYSSAAIIMRQKEELKDSEVIEIFIRIAGVALQKRYAESKLRESEEKWRTLVKNAPDIIMVIEPDGKISFVNRTVEGVTVEETEKKNLSEYFSPEHWQKVKKSLEAVFKEGKDAGFEIKSADLRGFVTYSSIHVGPLKTNNIISSAIFICRDITELKEAQEKEKQTAAFEAAAKEAQKKALELQSAYDELKKTQRQLLQAEKLTAVGVLASGVAHEIKNPMGIIMQGVEYLNRSLEALDPQQGKVLKMIEEAVIRANRIIMGLLNFAAPAAPSMSDNNIVEIAESALELVLTQLTPFNLEIKKEFGDNLPLLRLDENQIKQVFVNIFMNSVQAMPKGGVLTLKAHTQAKYLLIKGAALVFEIADTGSGIKPENLNRIFEPFFTTKPAGQGVGLGLSISQSIIKEHGGIIEMDSEIGRGTRTKIVLPIGRSGDEKTADN